MKVDKPNPYGELSAVTLEKFEADIGYRLPEDYRKFLMQYNGGVPVDCEILVNGFGRTAIDRMPGVYSERRIDREDLRGLWSDDYEYLPSNMINFADDGCGLYFGMFLAGEQMESIYMFEPEALQSMLEESDLKTGLRAEGTYFVANTFTKFLELLEKDS